MRALWRSLRFMVVVHRFDSSRVRRVAATILRNTERLIRQAGCRPAVRPLGDAARAVQPAADLHAAARADQGQANLMTMFAGAVGATFAAFGIDAVYTPAGGDPIPVRVIARRPDTIVGFGETRIHTECSAPAAPTKIGVGVEALPRPPASSSRRSTWRCSASPGGQPRRHRAPGRPRTLSRRWTSR
jgi:hypothetical protein